jgi:hypothetical protein
VLEGCKDGSLHLPTPFIDILNKTEHSTYLILPFWLFLGFLYFSFSHNDIISARDKYRARQTIGNMKGKILT